MTHDERADVFTETAPMRGSREWYAALVADYRAVEREALEMAAAAMCELCRLGSQVRTLHRLHATPMHVMGTEEVGYQYEGRCDALAIRALIPPADGETGGGNG